MAHEDEIIRLKREGYIKKHPYSKKHPSSTKDNSLINPVNIKNLNSNAYGNKNIISSSSFDDLRRIINICDESLMDNTKNDSNANLRFEIVKRIHNKDILVDIAKNDSNANVRMEAVKRIHYEDILADIAKNDSDEDIRQLAIKKINNESILRDILKNTSDKKIQKSAKKRLKQLGYNVENISQNNKHHN